MGVCGGTREDSRGGVRPPGSLHPEKQSPIDTCTMKGPWESIATGLEKGHKTQKLEKAANHASKRVGTVSAQLSFRCALRE